MLPEWLKENLNISWYVKQIIKYIYYEQRVCKQIFYFRFQAMMEVPEPHLGLELKELDYLGN